MHVLAKNEFKHFNRPFDFIYFIMVLWYQKITLQVLTYYRTQRVIRRWWVRRVNRRKRQQGFVYNLFREIKSNDHEEFFVYTRLSPEQYKILLELITPYLRKCSIRKSLSSDTRLAITLT